jgi:zinc finger protein ubi-d4
LSSTFSDSFYREAIENSSNYNNRLVVERKTRLPFIDSQTGVAQNDCFLWMQKWERMPGMTDGQVYSYPVRRWKKKRRQYLLNHTFHSSNAPKADQSSGSAIEATNGTASTFEVNGTNGMEALAVSQQSAEEAQTEPKFFVERESRNESSSNWTAEFEDATDIPDAAELDDDSDFDDYEEFGSRKKRRKKVEPAPTPTRRRKIHMDPNHEKPFQCEICKMRYKTRPGLTYHYTHIHSNDTGPERKPTIDEDDSQTSNTGTASNGKTNSSTSNSPLPPVTAAAVGSVATANPNLRLTAGSQVGSPVPPVASQSNHSSSVNQKNGEESKEG